MTSGTRSAGLMPVLVAVVCGALAGAAAVGGPSPSRPASRPTTGPATRPAGTLPPAEAARVRALVKRLGDAEAEVREAARDGLRDVGPRAAPYLIEGLEDPSGAVRAGAARALALVGGPETLQPLTTSLLGDPEAAVREQAAHALGALGHVAALSALARGLRDADPAVRAAAALSIGQAVRIARARPLSAEQRALAATAVMPLIDALADGESGVRGNAAMSLGVLRDPRALAPLALAALDKDPLVRASVCHGLADLGEVGGCGALVALLDDGDITVRRSAIEGLEQITGLTLGYDPRAPEAERRAAVARWQAWWNRTRSRLAPAAPRG